MAKQPLPVEWINARKYQRLAAVTDDPELRRRLLALSELAKGTPLAEVCCKYEFTRQRVRQLIIIARDNGPRGLLKQAHIGRPRHASIDEMRALAQYLLDAYDPVKQQSLRTIREACDFFKERFGRVIAPGTMREWVHDLLGIECRILTRGGQEREKRPERDINVDRRKRLRESLFAQQCRALVDELRRQPLKEGRPSGPGSEGPRRQRREPLRSRTIKRPSRRHLR